MYDESDTKLLLAGGDLEVWRRSGGGNPGFSIVRLVGGRKQTVKFVRADRGWRSQQKEICAEAQRLAGGTLTAPDERTVKIAGNLLPKRESFETVAMMDQWHNDGAQSAWGEQIDVRRR